jgi:hypothetical protein
MHSIVDLAATPTYQQLQLLQSDLCIPQQVLEVLVLHHQHCLPEGAEVAAHQAHHDVQLSNAANVYEDLVCGSSRSSSKENAVAAAVELQIHVVAMMRALRIICILMS